MSKQTELFTSNWGVNQVINISEVMLTRLR